MVGLMDLWLPMIVAAAVVTVAALVLHRVWPVAAGTAGPVTGDAAARIGGFFVFALAVAFVVAYVTGRALPPGSDYKAVFRIAATVAILAYAFGHLGSALRGARSWESALREVAHGVVYGLLTGGPFGWLWPDA
jgi:hypothetical protein